MKEAIVETINSGGLLLTQGHAKFLEFEKKNRETKKREEGEGCSFEEGLY